MLKIYNNILYIILKRSLIPLKRILIKKYVVYKKNINYYNYLLLFRLVEARLVQWN